MFRRLRVCATWSLLACCAVVPAVGQQNRSTDSLLFQTDKPWSPRTNVGSDMVLVYGIDDSLAERVQSWKAHGYHAAVMTGVAWGRYGSYLRGDFDGKQHWDETQQARDGHLFLHGGREVPYVSPSESYGRYLAAGVIRALDAGAEAVYLEEPEFWADAGWSDSFKRSWQAFYKQPWQPPDSSPDAQYRASQLKYFLYRRALQQVFEAVRAYGQAHGRRVPCYVATHSLPNYAQWRIVSPQFSLLDAGVDGFIAQVWTGTARATNSYEGVTAERTFATAFLEYGALQNIARSSGKPIWYLNDPIEDNPNHSWTDYRRNWESTLTASLLQPAVSRYEVLPWPNRIFEAHALYPSTEPEAGKPAPPRIPIPAGYATELQTVFHALRDLGQHTEAAQWEHAGTEGLGVLVSDSLMFQRAEPTPSDPNLGQFYGLALPLLLHGMPVEAVTMEGVLRPGAQGDPLDRYRVLLLSYEGQKPPSAAFHQRLAAWVRKGGALIVVDNDSDPYNNVTAWWNTGRLHDGTPRADLFRDLHLPLSPQGVQHVGKGTVVYSAQSPTSLSKSATGATAVLDLLRQAADASRLTLTTSPALVMRRGPYVIAAGLDQTVAATPTAPVILRGRLLDLFDPALSVHPQVELHPGERALLLDLDRIPAGAPRVLAAAARIQNEHATGRSLTFDADGIDDTAAVACISSAQPPTQVQVAGQTLSPDQYTQRDGQLWLHFTNRATPQAIAIRW